jgi:DNA-binding NarL/FixJ family response regulator
MRILVADHDAAFAVPLSLALSRFGVVSLVQGGEAARTALLSRPAADIALYHVSLPGVDGYRLLQEIRSARPEMARRILFYTGNPNTATARGIAQLHVRPLLVKPFSMDRMKALLEEIAAEPL